MKTRDRRGVSGGTVVIVNEWSYKFAENRAMLVTELGNDLAFFPAYIFHMWHELSPILVTFIAVVATLALVWFVMVTLRK